MLCCYFHVCWTATNKERKKESYTLIVFMVVMHSNAFCWRQQRNTGWQSYYPSSSKCSGSILWKLRLSRLKSAESKQAYRALIMRTRRLCLNAVTMIHTVNHASEQNLWVNHHTFFTAHQCEHFEWVTLLTFYTHYYRDTSQSQGETTGSTSGPATLPSMEIYKMLSPHHHTPTWQRDGWQLIIAPEGGIADEFASVRVRRSEWRCPAARRETPATQDALLLHHWDGGSSLGAWQEGKEGSGGGKETQG